MSDTELRALLDLFMCSDPWPLSMGEQKTIEAMLDREAQRRGYEGWVEALWLADERYRQLWRNFSDVAYLVDASRSPGDVACEIETIILQERI